MMLITAFPSLPVHLRGKGATRGCLRQSAALDQGKHRVKSISLGRWFVGSDSVDTRKPERHTGAVTRGTLRGIEGDLEHKRLFHLPHWPEASDRVVADPTV
jgi:hypothetical protein